MANNISIEGRHGADPELQISQNNTPWMRLRVADSWKDEVVWWTVKLFGEVATNFAAAKASKGDLVMVTGRVVDDSFTAKDGSEVTQIAINGFSIGLNTRFMGSNDAAQRQGGGDPQRMQDSGAWARMSGGGQQYQPPTVDEEPF